jgi:hypothetical protein
MGHVFISYARKDLAEVNKILEHLKQAKLDLWVDQESIGPGDQIPANIAKAILEAEKQGNRISTFEDCQQIVIIPSCLQSFGMNATFGRFFIFEQIERQMAQDG